MGEGQLDKTCLESLQEILTSSGSQGRLPEKEDLKSEMAQAGHRVSAEEAAKALWPGVNLG